jgi:hypothetical protein
MSFELRGPELWKFQQWKGSQSSLILPKLLGLYVGPQIGSCSDECVAYARSTRTVVVFTAAPQHTPYGAVLQHRTKHRGTGMRSPIYPTRIRGQNLWIDSTAYSLLSSRESGEKLGLHLTMHDRLRI